jgi:dimethylamine monooxygenase subunit A
MTAQLDSSMGPMGFEFVDFASSISDALHGIQPDGVPVDAEQLRALPGDHMQRLLPPPQTVLMNAYPADDPSWLRIDSTYPQQMRQRLALLATRRTWVVDRLDSQAAWLAETELRDRVVQWLTTQHPRAFTRQGDHVACHLTGVVVDVGPQGAQPMVAVAALATEDFLLMLPSEADAQGQVGYRLMSGALLFPNGWSLRSCFDRPDPGPQDEQGRAQWERDRQLSRDRARLGRSTREIHQGAVPQYEAHLATSVDRAFHAMRPERVVWRRNWGPHLSPRLFRHADALDLVPPMTPERLLEHGFIRSEHQTLVKLQRSAAIVFGLKTYLWPMRDMLADPQVRSALEVAARRTWPETREYMLGRHEVLMALLGAPARGVGQSSTATPSTATETPTGSEQMTAVRNDDGAAR